VAQGSLFEAAGGYEGLLELADAWHARVMQDAVVAHAFEKPIAADHAERLAAYLAEATGGGALYTSRYADETQVVRIHSGNGEHGEMDRRAVACFEQALADTGLTARAPAAAEQLLAYFAWTTHNVMARYHGSADEVPAGLQMTRWNLDGRG
jgi:hemoglobin